MSQLSVTLAPFQIDSFYVFFSSGGIWSTGFPRVGHALVGGDRLELSAGSDRLGCPQKIADSGWLAAWLVFGCSHLGHSGLAGLPDGDVLLPSGVWGDAHRDGRKGSRRDCRKTIGRSRPRKCLGFCFGRGLVRSWGAAFVAVPCTCQGNDRPPADLGLCSQFQHQTGRHLRQRNW
jgi:hypothetical protein